MRQFHRILALIILAAVTRAASAAPVLSITNLISGTNGGSFDVTLSNPGGTQHIQGYTATFTVSPHAGAVGSLVFSGNFATIAPSPLFAGQDPAEISSGSIRGGTDSAGTSPFYTIGGDGTGLYRANYTYAAGTSGTFDIILNTATGPLKTKLIDDTATEIPGLTVQNASIIVVAPEPASGLLVLTLGGLLLGRRRRAVA